MTRTRFKKCLFGVILAALALVLLECVVLAVYGVARQRFFPYGEYRASIRGAAARTHDRRDPGDTGGPEGDEIIHPYLGYIQNPARDRISELGFTGTNSPALPSTNGLTVAVLGGSFAAHVCKYGEPVLVEALDPVAGNVRVLNLATGGYKQPQQLNVLTYLLSLGARFDVLVNIDGFNEVALPPAENVPNGVFPFYPRGWHLRVADVFEPAVSMGLLRLDQVRMRRKSLAAVFDGSPLSCSAFGCLLWKSLDRRLASRQTSLLCRLMQTPADSRPLATGPSFVPGAEADVFTCLAEHWARCSRMLNDVCVARGIRYFHFLQPNQYVPGSKPIGAEEASIAVDPQHPYRGGVIAGYPILRRLGVELANELEFHDMTMLFAGNETVLYADTCCHLSREGYVMFAEAIGAVMAGRPLRP